MNTLSQQAIIEYQVIYKQAFGKDISYEQAEDQGTRLVRLVQAVLRPIPLSEINIYGLEVRKNANKS